VDQQANKGDRSLNSTTKCLKRLDRLRSPAYVPDASSSSTQEFVYSVVARLADGTSGERRELRQFVGAWLDNWLHSGPTPEAQQAITRDLARQGWFVRDRRLVVGEPVRGADRAYGDNARDARIAALHESVKRVAQRPFEAGEPAAAVFEAFKAVNSRVRGLAGMDLDGRDLMAQAFRLPAPKLLLAALDSKTGESIQEGYQLLFMGAMAAIRNPHAHEVAGTMDENEVLEQLALASLLMRRLDDAQLAEGDVHSTPAEPRPGG
jgi:uncharacterized protein (TIGR02391 family)